MTPERESGDTAFQEPSENRYSLDSACAICGDIGWLRVEAPVGHPSFGKAVPCDCQRREDDPSRLARLQRYSNMGPLTRSTFQVTRPEGKSAKAEDQELFRRGYEIASAYAEDPSGWLVFTGPSGSGKTHLAAAIANGVLEAGSPVFFVFVPDLLDHLRSAFAPTSELSFDQLFEQVRNAPFLVLDDFGAHSSTPWAQEKLYQVLNHRHSNRLPTVFTLGSPIEEMDSRFQTRFGDPEVAVICLLGAAERIGLSGQIGSLKPELLERMTFDNFNVWGNRASAKQKGSLEGALQAAREYARDPQGWLVLMGPTGSGKTHLVHAIANERLKLGREMLYFQVADLLDYLRVTYSPDSTVTYDKMFEEVRNAPLLALEDFGTHYSTPWAREKLHQILVHRHDVRLPTLITSTDEEEDGEKKGVKKKSDPISSRMLDSTLVAIVEIDAPDYRDRGRGR